MAARHLGKLAVYAKALRLVGPRRNGKRNEHCLYDRMAELRKRGLRDVNGTGNHSLWTTLSQPKNHSKNAPCRGNRRWASTATGQVWFSERHQLVKMGGAHTHIPKEAPLINTLLEKTADQVTGVGGSPVGHAAYAPHTGELSQSDKLGRRT